MTHQIETIGDAQDMAEHFPAVQFRVAHVRHAFSSPETFADWLDKHGTRKAWLSMSKVESICGHHRCGGLDYRDSIRVALAGWTEGAEQAARLRDKITAANPHGPRLARWDVAGAYPNMARALAGNPLHMRRMDSARLKRRPVLTLVSHFGAMSSVDGDTMLRRAAVVAAIVDAVESAGYSSQVIAWTASSHNGNSKTGAETACVLKDAGQPLDVARLAFGLGHPALLRRMTFAARAAMPSLRILGETMGRTHSDVTLTAEQNADGTFLIPAIQYLGEDNFNSDDRAATRGLRAIIANLSRQGCPAFPDDRAA